MLSLAGLRNEGIPDEIANRMMMAHGSRELLRVLRGNPNQAAPHAIHLRPAHRRSKYVPVSERPAQAVPEAVRQIIEGVCDAFDIPPEWVTSRTRKRRAVHARCVAVKLIRERTWGNGEPKHSTTMIGCYIGRDHSTICHSLANFESYCRYFPEVAEVYRALRDTEASVAA